MELISDALLIAGALGASIYCRVLAGRLAAFKNLDTGMGASIAALSRQVDEMRMTLDAAKQASGGQTKELRATTERAEKIAGKLEILLASTQGAAHRGATAARRAVEEEALELSEPMPARRYAPRGGRLEDAAQAADDGTTAAQAPDFAAEFDAAPEPDAPDSADATASLAQAAPSPAAAPVEQPEPSSEARQWFGPAPEGAPDADAPGEDEDFAAAFDRDLAQDRAEAEAARRSDDGRQGDVA